MPLLSGLIRNRVQCLDDFGIPLLLSHTVTRVEGERRVEGVYIAQVDDKRLPIPDTERFIACDTLLLSVGLIPENELTRAAGIILNPITKGPEVDQRMQTVVPGLFACGNVAQVHDLVDNVSWESEIAGKAAAEYAKGTLPTAQYTCSVKAGTGIHYVCPQRIEYTNSDEIVRLSFRVSAPGRRTLFTARCKDNVLSKKMVVCVSPVEMEHLDFKLTGMPEATIMVTAEGTDING